VRTATPALIENLRFLASNVAWPVVAPNADVVIAEAADRLVELQHQLDVMRQECEDWMTLFKQVKGE